MKKDNLNKTKINSYNFEWMNNFKKVGRLKEIDRNIVDSFIENIYVGDNKNLKIIFKYSDEYKVVLEYLKNQKSVL